MGDGAAAALWGDTAAMVAAVAPAEEDSQPRPKHICREGEPARASVTVTLERSFVAPWTRHRWRECPGCLYDRVERYARQIQHERQERKLFTRELDPADWTKERARWKKREGAVYVAFPLDSGRIAVVHNQGKEGGRDLDGVTWGGLVELLHDWANTPEGERVQTTRKFGGDFAGAKGNTKARQERQAAEELAAEKGEPLPPQVTLKVGASPRKIARHFGVTANKRQKATIVADWYAVYLGLQEIAGGDVQTIDGQPTLPALLLAFIQWGKDEEKPADVQQAEKPRPRPVFKRRETPLIRQPGHEGKERVTTPQPAPLGDWITTGGRYASSN